MVAACAAVGLLLGWVGAEAQQPGASRVLGTVTAVNGNSLAVRTDAGGTVNVTVPDSARVLRTQPGQKTLAGATKMAVSEIGAGDRVLMMVAGDPPTASVVLVNTKADLEAKHEQEQEEWQKTGVGGLVKTVDAAGGTITIMSGARTITIKTTPETVIRRYAPDSVKFSDAQASTLGAIQPGDQVTARGEHSPDGAEVTAAEIVSGSFRNIPGLVTSVDASAGTLRVKDLITKKEVTIHTTPDSDMRKLDPQMAQMIAMRLRAGAAGPGQGHGGPGAPGAAPADAPGAGGGAGGGQAWRQYAGAGGGSGGGAWQGRAGGGAGNGGGGGNMLARLLQRSPQIHVGDLHKGDAVMIVATSGSPDSATAIRLVAGVEPMLQASASGSASMFSSAWSLGGGQSQQGDASGGGEGGP